MGALTSKSLTKYVNLCIKYIDTLSFWKRPRRQVIKDRPYSKFCKKSPTTSCFFNLLRSVQYRYPQLNYKQVVAIGTQVWNQMTWSEKQPYYLLAWKEQLKKEARHKRSTQKCKQVKNSEKRYNLRSTNSSGHFNNIDITNVLDSASNNSPSNSSPRIQSICT